jgi:hypothetical protein
MPLQELWDCGGGIGSAGRLQEFEELGACAGWEGSSGMGNDVCVTAVTVGLVGEVEADGEAAGVGGWVGVGDFGNAR